MNPVTFYIIFHKDVLRENTAEFSEEELRFFNWVAVNEQIPKEIPDWIPSECLLKEWEFPKYAPNLQADNFYQNSVFFHLFWNSESIKSNYIGFGQYDMKIGANDFRTMIQTIETNEPNLIFAPFVKRFEWLYISPICKEDWDYAFLEPYNTFFKTAHTFEQIETLPLCLLHTFVIPTWFFKRIMPFMEVIVPHLLNAFEGDRRHLAGTLERIFALCISCGILEGLIKRIIILNGFQHDDGQRFEDAFRGISGRA